MPKFAVLVFPGSNCDHDCFHVIKHVMGQSCEFLWHEERDIDEFDCIVVPGGFSYGDYLRAGAIARLSPVMESVADFASNGGLVLGICNGFQILAESGLLPGALGKNASLRFVCKWVYLRVENNDTPFTQNFEQGEVLRIPIAHGEGSYIADEQTLQSIEDSDRVIFRYVDEHGEPTQEANPNGSAGGIAAVANDTFNVLGMMPHPERCSEEEMNGTDGYRLFESVITWLEKRKNTNG